MLAYCVFLIMGAYLVHRYMGHTPVASLAAFFFAQMVLGCCFGMLGLLYGYTLACYIGVLALLVLTVCKDKKASLAAAKGFFTLPMVLFVVGGVFFYLLFTLRQPMAAYWDEFILWSKTAKVLSLSNTLYTFAPAGLLNAVTPPGSAVLSYTAQFWAGGFQDHGIYYAYSLLYMVVFATAAEFVWQRTRLASATVVAFVAFVFSPFLFRLVEGAGPAASVVAPYLTSMVDFTLTAVFLGALLLYFLARESGLFLAPLGYLAFVKDTGLLLALLAGGMVLLLTVVGARRDKAPVGAKKGITHCALPLLVPPAAYMAWLLHVRLVLQNRPQSNGAGAVEMSLPSMVASGFAQLVAPAGRSEKFSAVLDNFLRYFLTTRENLLGSFALMVVLALLLGGVGFLLAEKQNRGEIVVMNVALLLGTAGYFLFLFFCYVFIFRGGEEYALAGLDRYGNTMCMAFLLWNVLLLFWVAGRNQLRSMAVSLALFLVAGAAVARIGLMHTVFGYREGAFARSQELQQLGTALVETMGAGKRLLLIDQSTQGNPDFEYYIYPVLANWQPEGAMPTDVRYVAPGDPREEEPYYGVLEPAAFGRGVLGSFDYVYVKSTETSFDETYGHFFATPPKAGRLYEVGEEDGALRLQPKEMAE